MERLIKQAVLGTARHASDHPPLPHPLDPLGEPLAALSDEHRLLLSAAAADVASRAGYRPGEVTTFDPPASEPDRPVCAVRVAALLRDMLSGHHRELLREALRRIDAAGQRLPPPLLPTVLDVNDEDVRALLRPVLGQRGAWLGRLRPAWSWAAATDQLTIEDAEHHWNDGPHDQRRRALDFVRARDPELGRRWLEAAWECENAAHRAELLTALSVGFETGDEPLLDRSLADRSNRVRREAAVLLATLTGSTFRERLQRQLDDAVPVERSRGRLRVAVASRLELDKRWPPPGVFVRRPKAIGETCWRLWQLTALSSPAWWQQRCDGGPAEVLAALDDPEWNATLLSGLTDAAKLHGAEAWYAPLWDAWAKQRSGSISGENRDDVLFNLLRRMCRDESESRVLPSLGRPTLAGVNACAALACVPQPWTEPFAAAWLDGFSRTLSAMIDDGLRAAGDCWYPTLPVAAVGLPPACFESALVPRQLPSGRAVHWRKWRQALDEFQQTVRVRQAVHELT